MARACCGVTRAGRPCSLTSESTLVDDKGRSVAAPLRRGGDRCIIHAQPFSTRPVANLSGNLVILMLDLETTGVDATQDRIVELSAVQALPKSPGACFSTVVQVDGRGLNEEDVQQSKDVNI